MGEVAGSWGVGEGGLMWTDATLISLLELIKSLEAVPGDRLGLHRSITFAGGNVLAGSSWALSGTTPVNLLG